MSEAGNIAAAALRGVLADETALKRIDERLFEALLARALTRTQGFAQRLALPKGDFTLGGRGFPDVVHRDDGGYLAGIEVKLRSQHNFWRAAGRWQLEVYAANAEEDTDLVLVTTPAKRRLLEAELEAEDVRDRERWRFVTTSEISSALVDIGTPGSANETVDLVLALARVM